MVPKSEGNKMKPTRHHTDCGWLDSHLEWNNTCNAAFKVKRKVKK